MTTATGEGDDDIVTMEMDPVDESEAPKKRGLLPEGTARIVFLVLAGVALLSVLIAIIAIWKAPANAVALLIGALVVLAIVVLAEVVLLILARPRRP